jgi:hypothetical protein
MIESFPVRQSRTNRYASSRVNRLVAAGIARCSQITNDREASVCEIVVTKSGWNPADLHYTRTSPS